MGKRFNGLLILLLLTVLCACGRKDVAVWKAGIETATDTVAYQDVFGDGDGEELVVREDVDLNGRRCRLPKGVTLNFQGGVIKNGTLVGDETSIESTGVCFDRVRVQGTWNVYDISTSMFRDLDYDNSLKDVVALANPQIQNRIVIEEGDYQVTASKEDIVCLLIGSNTELVINGTIRMTPNDLEGCDVIRAWGEHIQITGTGTIVGDKHTHTGTTGERGMGIEVIESKDVAISGLTVKDCWGDCIYVGEESTNVLIANCQLDHGRRQGVSVTAADSVTIRECTITNVAGTAPEYGIDVEPNAGEVVDHVTIEEVTVNDCKGGFLVYGRADDARVGTVMIRNCTVSSDKKPTFAVNKCDTLIVQDCDLTLNNGFIGSLKDWVKPLFGKEKAKVMEIKECGTARMVGNNERKQ